MSAVVDIALAVVRGRALIAAGRDREAVAVAMHVLAVSPDDAELLDLLASAYLEVDDEAALEAAERLLVVSPDGYRGHALASTACDNIGRKDDAERHAHAAIEAAPWLPLPYILLSNAIVGRTGRR